jgi:uncharacterized membrane protein
VSAVVAPPARAPSRQPQLFPAAAERPEPTLEQLVAGRWAELRAGSVAECVLCGGALEPRWSAGHGVVGSRCRSCGTSLD